MARVAVVGLWHLGCVVAASLAYLGHSVVGTDFDEEVARSLQQGKTPIYEPGLAELIAQQQREGRLAFWPSCSQALAGAECIFITFDTPVDEGDQVDLQPVELAFDAVANHGRGEVQVILMSQVPVGTCQRLAARLREQAPHLAFTLFYQPENLRLGEALKSFLQPDLIVIGTEDYAAAGRLLRLYEGIQAPRLTMSRNSAEMAKHALNAFLATSISFVNELADLAELCGADVRDVVRVLRMDRRIGPHAFLSPGAGFSGGTLARDVQTLRQLGQRLGYPTRQLDATLEVNALRLPNLVSKIHQLCGGLRGLRVGLLGLTYKPGTNTLRRSHALALARVLLLQGSDVRAFDPQVRERQPETQGIMLCQDPYEVAEESDVIIVTTPWPEFMSLNLARLRNAMRQPTLIDAHNCLDDAAARRAGFRYCGIGIPRTSG